MTKTKKKATKPKPPTLEPPTAERRERDARLAERAAQLWARGGTSYAACREQAELEIEEAGLPAEW